MWLVFAILSSIFAALTSILAKVGIEGVDSNLATGRLWYLSWPGEWSFLRALRTVSGRSAKKAGHF